MYKKSLLLLLLTLNLYNAMDNNSKNKLDENFIKQKEIPNEGTSQKMNSAILEELEKMKIKEEYFAEIDKLSENSTKLNQSFRYKERSALFSKINNKEEKEFFSSLLKTKNNKNNLLIKFSKFRLSQLLKSNRLNSSTIISLKNIYTQNIF